MLLHRLEGRSSHRLVSKLGQSLILFGRLVLRLGHNAPCFGVVMQLIAGQPAHGFVRSFVPNLGTRTLQERVGVTFYVVKTILSFVSAFCHLCTLRRK